MSELERYSRIIGKAIDREFLLLQGTGCKWGKCTYCDYYLDTSDNPFKVNKPILDKVKGDLGVLDIINSGSCTEFDEVTLEYIEKIVKEKQIKELWFEAHWTYREKLAEFASRFGIPVHFRTGVESFNPNLRISWKKGIPRDIAPEDIAKYFDGLCLLVGVGGQTIEDIMQSIEIAEKYFLYYNVNLFCENTTNVKRDNALAKVFIEKIVPVLSKSKKAEVLIDNTDLGVG